MEADGQAVTKESWRAAIPLQLRLADNEVSSLEQPPVLYFLVPRQSYLHSVVPQALAVLQHLLPHGELAPWFEHGHLPLKWGVPAGVLYDLVAAPSGELPWRLTIHFRGFPDRMLPAYSGEAALRGAFFNSLKEAACICRGSAQRVMEMAGGAQEDLWRQVLTSSWLPYSQILASLQLAPVALRGGRRPAVPLRLYVRRDAGGYMSSYEDIAASSRPVEVHAADGSSLSLQEALVPLLVECLAAGGVMAGSAQSAAEAAPEVQSLPNTPIRRNSSTAGDGGGGSSERGASVDAEAPTTSSPAEPEAVPTTAAGEGHAAASQALCELLPSPAKGNAAASAAIAARLLESAAMERRLLVGGVTPPLDTPLAWLHARLHAADYFLYIVLHVGGASASH